MAVSAAVYGSLESSRSLGDYAEKRVRRLYPAYAFVILARFGDLSYGIYLIHFPIIQAVVRAGVFRESPGQGVGVSLMIIVLTALLLWRFIEKPALRADSAYRRHRNEHPAGPPQVATSPTQG